MKKEPLAIIIEVDIQNDKLISPIKIGKQEITNLGIYKEEGIAFWVVKKILQPQQEFCEYDYKQALRTEIYHFLQGQVESTSEKSIPIIVRNAVMDIFDKYKEQTQIKSLPLEPKPEVKKIEELYKIPDAYCESNAHKFIKENRDKLNEVIRHLNKNSGRP